MNRQFGIELEIAGISRVAALNALQIAGIEVVDMRYTHETTREWKIVPDASVRDGFEIVSPILRGEDGLAQAALVCRALEAIGTKVNRTCGFHVHFDAQNMSVNEIKTIVTRYAGFEDVIDGFMPMSRRANNNQYCESIRPLASFNSFQQATTIQQLAFIQNSRYYKINLQSYTRHGTIEFRQHSGTVDSEKVVNWICFLDDFVTRSCEVANQLFSVEINSNVKMPTAKGQKALYDFLVEKCTAHPEQMIPFAWLKSHLGYTESTLIDYIWCLRNRCNLHIEGTKRHGFRLVRDNVSVTRNEITDSVYAGVDIDRVTFYRNRTAALAA